MSWHFSRAQAEAFSAASSWDGNAFALSRSTTTPAAFLSHGRTTGLSRLSRYGTTYELLTEALGEALLTWCLEASRVTTSAAQGRAQGSTATSRGSGQKWPASFSTWSRSGSLWRTHQCSLLAGSDEFLETWPKWGSMRNGESWERMPHPLAHPISATEFGSLLATPTAKANQLSPEMQRKWPWCRAWTQPLPTPSACNYGTNQGGGMGRTGKVRPSLQTMARKNLWPDAQPNQATVGGPLAPEFTEWLLTWPIGWTDIGASATANYQRWFRLFGEFSRNDWKSDE